MKVIQNIRAAALAVLMSAYCAAGALAQSTNAQLLALIAGNVPSGNPSVLTAASLRAVLNAMVNSTNVAGTSCPTSSLTTLQPWGNTTTTPTGVTLNVFDGTSCVPWALLNETAHQVTVAGSASPVAGRNIIARFGSMDVYQRGAGNSATIGTPASSTTYTVDGCYLSAGANEAGGVTNLAGRVPGSYRTAYITRNSGQTGTAQMTFGCPMDSDEIALTDNEYVALSFMIQAGPNWSPVSGSITVSLLCGTGSPVKQVVGYSNQVTILSSSIALIPGGSFTRQQVTSAAIVPNTCAQMEVQWTWSPTGTAGANDAFLLDEVQLEAVSGPTAVATPYDVKDFATQLRLAQRHFVKTFPYGTAPAQNVGVDTGELYAQATVAGTSATGNKLLWRFPVQMRVSPSMTTYNPAATNSQVRDENASADCSATFFVSTTQDAVTVGTTGNSSTSVGFLLGVHATADAGI